MRRHPSADTAAAAEAYPAQPAERDEPQWAQSLANGVAGIALLHIERAHSGAGSWEVAHEWLTAATRQPLIANAASSLYFGVPAVAFALNVADRTGYDDALHTLDTHIHTLSHRRLARARARIHRGTLPALGEYDLIYGMTGLGVYLLHREPRGALIRDVLSYLVRLTEPLRVCGEWLPGWWTDRDPADEISDRFPRGHANLGMAHGICGPLALLALAKNRRVVVDGHIQAIGRICAWLDTWRQHGDTGAWWPQWITYEELNNGQARQAGPLRPSWCYGTPGQARAQQLAGKAMGDTVCQQMAEDALLNCLADTGQLAQIRDASLCHGWAGLIHTVWRSAADADSPELAARLPELLARFMEHSGRIPAPEARGKESGLLEGAAGVALGISAAATASPPATSWDACLLIN